MKTFCRTIFTVFLLVALVVGCLSGCTESARQSPILTPAKDAYICHKQDGSADPWAVSCQPQNAKCCPENYRCDRRDAEYCEYTGSDAVNRYTQNNTWLGAPKRVKRTPENPQVAP